MAQKVLDPRNIGAGKPWKPSGPLPRHVRDFGYFPDFTVLLPGDLLLVSALDPLLVSTVIISAQERGGYAQEDARWHHAAMYFGEGLGNCLCEAVAKDGIRQSPLYPYIGKHLLRFRRDPTLDISTRWRIVVRALTRLGHSYSKSRLVELAAKAMEGYWKDVATADASAIICSEFYSDAYSVVTKKVLKNTIAGEATPAYLSCCAELEDIEVGWLRIGDR